MSGEFNIFKNLDDLKKNNLLAQLKDLECAKSNSANNSQDDFNDSFDFDALLDNNKVKSPSKRTKNKETKCTPEKKTKKNGKSRSSSTSSDRSSSPVVALLENLSNNIDKPVGRRTRRSLEAAKNTATASPKVLTEEEEFRQLYGEPLDHKGKRRSKGRGRGGWGLGLGRGRGRGRGRGKKAVAPPPAATSEESSEISENIQSLPSSSSSNDVSEQDCEQASSSLSIMARFLQGGSQDRNVMRARRNYVAEVAARSTNVDYVDLVSSPWPRVEGMITIDSDTEDSPRMTRAQKRNQEEKPFTINSSKSVSSKNNAAAAASLDLSYEDDNPELSVKINWKGQPETFKLRKYQKFSIIFEKLAQRESTNIENLVFNLGNVIISENDTPDSINYKTFQFIDGRVLANRFNSPGAAVKKRNANKVTLKIQSDKLKRPLQIDLMKTDKFRILYIKCSEELKIGIEQLKLSFDGEFLELNDTPADLDLEGGEAIDLRIKN